MFKKVDYCNNYFNKNNKKLLNVENQKDKYQYNLYLLSQVIDYLLQ